MPDRQIGLAALDGKCLVLWFEIENRTGQYQDNRSYLGQIFYKETNMKFTTFLMCYRMNVAKELLINTNDKVSYIARKLGYTNMNYFYTHFQKCRHKAPTDFR